MKIVVVNQPQWGLGTVYQALQGQGYDVVYIQEMRELFVYIEEQEPFILLYDYDEIPVAERTLCQKMKVVNSIPVVMLTKDPQIVANHTGQLVVQKPFYFPVLLRQLKKFMATNQEVAVEPVKWELRSKHYELVIDDEIIPLASKEVAILTLLTKTNEFISREELTRQLWGEVSESTIRATEYQLGRIRKKIAAFSGRFEIKTIYRNGYRIEVRN